MSTSNKICNDGASKLNDDVCEMNDMLHNMSTAADDNNNVPVCANCGKEGRDVNNTCNKCKSVMYCNAACKKKHRSKHKKACNKRVAELHDEALFKQPPLEYEDCPICFLRMPSLDTGRRYNTCCGKTICSGCAYAPVYDNEGSIVDETCPFCRIPTATSNEEVVKRTNKRVEVGDATAICNLGFYYSNGEHGLPQNHAKVLELWHRAGELGYVSAYNNIGYAYESGRGAEVDKKKARHYYELAAMKGSASARNAIGIIEGRAGNSDRAIKHCMIAVRSGYITSLKGIKLLYTEGHATKDDYTKALQNYQEYLNEVKSVQRDEAAAAGEQYRYY